MKLEQINDILSVNIVKIVHKWVFWLNFVCMLRGGSGC